MDNIWEEMKSVLRFFLKYFKESKYYWCIVNIVFIEVEGGYPNSLGTLCRNISIK